MIEIKLSNKKVLTISDLNIESVHNRVLAYSPSMEQELYDIFSYPQCHWGDDRIAIVKRDFTMMVNGYLPEYFISLWVNGEPKDEKKYGSYVIVSFFADWNGKTPITELIEEYLSDLEEVFQSFSVDFEL
jgi:hypothetical protein